MFKFKSFFIYSILLITLSWAEAAEYRIILLEPVAANGLVERDRSKANTLSESGYVAGVVPNSPRWPVTAGFVYHPVHGFKLAQSPVENGDMKATLVNNQGVAVGFLNREGWSILEDSASCGFDIVPFSYDSQNGQLMIHDLDMPGDGYSLVLQDIVGFNDRGQMLLECWNRETFESNSYIYNILSCQIEHILPEGCTHINNQGSVSGQGWFFSQEGGVKELGCLDSQERFPVVGKVMSENSVVAGHGYESQGVQKGFLWDEKQGLRSFSTLGGSKIEIEAINERSQVIGSSKTFFGNTHAFIYDEALGIIDLGTLFGLNSWAFDVNDSTHVVGSSDTLFGRRAFIWDGAHGMRDLNDLIPKNSGWNRLTKATQINNQGMILGEGVYLGKKRHFLLVPKNQN